MNAGEDASMVEPGHEQPLQDRMVTPERSVFGTRIPRPTGVGRHLLVVVGLSMFALIIAIIFAERGTRERPNEAPAEAPAE